MMAEIPITESRAKTLNEAKALAFASRSNFATLSALWSLAYTAGRESEWSPISGCRNPFDRIVEDFDQVANELQAQQWQQVLYRRWGPTTPDTLGVRAHA